MELKLMTISERQIILRDLKKNKYIKTIYENQNNLETYKKELPCWEFWELLGGIRNHFGYKQDWVERVFDNFAMIEYTPSLSKITWIFGNMESEQYLYGSIFLNKSNFEKKVGKELLKATYDLDRG